MELRIKRTIAAGTALAAGLAGTVAMGGNAIAARPERAKNVIYMVGDGMGVTHIDAARQRYKGAAGELEMETPPVTGMTSTYAVEKGTNQPDLVTDSAASGTAWSSGVKTYNGAVGKDTDENIVVTLMEQAKAAGMRTGNVSTAEVTDATPAAMFSHVSKRGCQGPSAQMAASVCTSKDGQDVPVAQQVSRNNVADVIFGGGLQRFEPADQAALQANGYQVLGNFGTAPQGTPQTADSQTVAMRDDLDDISSDKVIGLFNRGNLTVEKFKRENPGSDEADEPSVSEMTTKALEILGKPDFPGKSEGKGNGKGKNNKAPGFFLQVESALIDKRSHANDADQTLEEMINFDEAVKVALAFARRDGNTLVIVTADHECAGFNIIGQGGFTNAEAVSPPGNIDGGNPANTSTDPGRVRGGKDPVRSPNIYNDPTKLAPTPERPTNPANSNNFAPATFRTADDPAGVQDGTPEASLWLSYLSGSHTGADVPVRALGPGARQFDNNNDNTDHYFFMSRALGLQPAGSQQPKR